MSEGKGPTALIVDASVIAKMVVAEPESEEVDARVMQTAGRFPLLAPPLLHHELENLVLSSNRRLRGSISPEELRRRVDIALDLVTEVADRPDPLPLAVKHRLSGYDATYLALTLDSGPGALLWTYDARLARAAEAEGVLARDEDFA